MDTVSVFTKVSFSAAAAACAGVWVSERGWGNVLDTDISEQGQSQQNDTRVSIYPFTSLAVGLDGDGLEWTGAELHSASFVVNPSLHSRRRLDLFVPLHDHPPGTGQEAEENVVPYPVVVVGGGVGARAVGL